jgi:hypothetical protein
MNLELNKYELSYIHIGLGLHLEDRLEHLKEAEYYVEKYGDVEDVENYIEIFKDVESIGILVEKVEALYE